MITEKIPFTEGLHAIDDVAFVYYLPDGTWGRSNAGLVACDGESLLIDTLWDLELTASMLEAMGTITAEHPLSTVLHTHGDGDHWWGNELLPEGVGLHATSEAISDMHAMPPSIVAQILAADLPPDVTEFIESTFSAFEFDGITPRPADIALDEPTTFRVGGTRVDFIPIGPAHTGGDAVVHLPERGIAFAGDALFIGGTPITWDGPVTAWIDACDRLLALDADVYVPGHGPMTDASGVRAVQDYLRFVVEEARTRYERGMSATEAALDIDLGPYETLGDRDRIVVNVDRVYSELEPGRPPTDRPILFGEMTRYRRANGMRR